MNYINDYNQKTDEELVSIIRKENNTTAINILIERYTNLVKYNANKFFLYGGDENDVFQEGMIGLYYAIKKYDENNGASFKTFAQICIDRYLITAIKLSNRQKHIPLNTAFSMNINVDNEDDNSREIITLLKNDKCEDPSEIIVNREFYKELTKKIEKNLSPKELNVLNEFKTGKSYAEIAKTLECNVKSVDTALTRIRRKAAKIKEELN